MVCKSCVAKLQLNLHGTSIKRDTIRLEKGQLVSVLLLTYEVPLSKPTTVYLLALETCKPEELISVTGADIVTPPCAEAWEADLAAHPVSSLWSISFEV